MKLIELLIKTTFSFSQFCEKHVGGSRQNTHARLSDKKVSLAILYEVSEGLKARSLATKELRVLIDHIIYMCEKKGLTHYEQGSLKGVNYERKLERVLNALKDTT